MARFAVGVPLILLLASAVSAQNPPQSDPQAVSFASKSIAALTGGNAISDVRLTGTVIWNGSDSGTGTFRALGTGEGMDLALACGTCTEIREASEGVTKGGWIAQEGFSGLVCLSELADECGGAPTLGSVSPGPSMVLYCIGQETSIAWPVQHVHSCVYESYRPSTPSLQRITDCQEVSRITIPMHVQK